MKGLRRATDAERASAALHEVRRGAKRLRYAAEAAVPIFGKPAARMARAAEEIQTVLGEHQDSVIIREKLRSLAATPSGEAGGGDSFTYGRLHALEQLRGAEARSRFHQMWRTSPPKRLRWK